MGAPNLNPGVAESRKNAMCLAIPGRIVEFEDGSRDVARVDVAGVRRRINVSLLLPEGVALGDWVLVHVGFAIARVDEAQAEETLRFLKGLEEFRPELDEFGRSPS